MEEKMAEDLFPEPRREQGSDKQGKHNPGTGKHNRGKENREKHTSGRIIAAFNRIRERKKQLNQAEKAKWLRRISQYLEQGYVLHETLNILAASTSGKEQAALQKMSAVLSAGNTLEEAFRQAGFSEYVLLMVSRAEVHGNFEAALRKASEWKLKRLQLKKEWLKVLTYPSILLVVMVVIVYVILHLVLPQFHYMFTSFDVTLPTSTVYTLTFFGWLNEYGWYVAGFGTTVLLVLAVCMQRPGVRRSGVAFMVRLPLVKRVVQVYYTVLFSVQLGFLLQASVPLHEAIQKMLSQSGSDVLRQQVSEVEKRILNGQTLGEALHGEDLFTPELHPVVYYAERNGRLAEQLIRYGVTLEKESIDEWIGRIKWVEPILLLGIGVLIAYMFIALFTPILQLIETI
jgi:competence protein ComGB